jgi:hypothetical protein
MATLDLTRLYADIDAYGQRLQQLAVEAGERATRYLFERTVARAREQEDWVTLADNIEVWSQDGRLVIGLTDNVLASQAFQLEYGDEHTPPSPLFRTMGGDLNAAQNMVNEYMAAGFGPGRYV